MSMAMKTYRIAEAKDQLPKLIDRVLSGEEVVITRRGTPVVALRPTAPRPEPPVGSDDLGEAEGADQGRPAGKHSAMAAGRIKSSARYAASASVDTNGRIG
jgi:prevent-host-death family protein